jgi:hypothetical protein
MPTTTNYGWTTPADTDLVKDGAAAIRTLGSSIDTTVFNNASAGIAKTIVDAKGDLIAATASDTVARLAVGTNGQVLLADSTAATGLAWGTPASGSLTLLSTTSLSGATTTISGISGSYKNLYGVIYGITNVTGQARLQIAPNESSVISSFKLIRGAVVSSEEKQAWFVTGTSVSESPLNTSANNAFSFIINNYASSTNYKTMQSVAIFERSAGNFGSTFTQGGILTNSAITSLSFSNNEGYSYSTGTILLYGVN